MRLPIQLQFMGPMLIVATTSLVLIVVLNSWLASQQTSRQIEQQLQGVLGVLANSRFPLTNSVLRQMGELAGGELILVDEMGNTLAASQADFSMDDIASLPHQPVASGQMQLAGPFEVEGDRYYHSASRMVARTPGAAPRTLHVLFPQQNFNAAWQLRFLPPLLVGGTTLAVVGLLTHLVTSRISRVIQQLQSGVRLLAEGGFQAVQLPATNDEIRDLAVDVNQTAERLQAYEVEVRDTERLRMLNLLGAGLAHEIRNAATGCRLAIDLCGEQPGHQPAEQNCLEVARGQLKLIEKRLSQFLQMTDKTPQLHREPTALNDVVSEVLELMQPSARHGGVRLDWQPNVAGQVLADHDQLTQVVMNLALNAVEAAAKQHALGKPAYLRAEIDQQQGQVELRIADSGTGPSHAVADKLFDSFVTDKPEGIGLGLAVARRVVESYGGKLSWCRQANETHFVVRLPALEHGETDG